MTIQENKIYIHKVGFKQKKFGKKKFSVALQRRWIAKAMENKLMLHYTNTPRSRKESVRQVYSILALKTTFILFQSSVTDER